MRKVTGSEDRETLLDHIVAGLISAIVMFFTAILGPVVVAAKAHGVGRTFTVLYRGFHIWAAAVVLIAFACGLVIGPKRMASVFGYLWGTEDPPNRRVSLMLWSGIAAIVGVSWWLS